MWSHLTLFGPKRSKAVHLSVSTVGHPHVQRWHHGRASRVNQRLIWSAVGHQLCRIRSSRQSSPTDPCPNRRRTKLRRPNHLSDLNRIQGAPRGRDHIQKSWKQTRLRSSRPLGTIWPKQTGQYSLSCRASTTIPERNLHINTPRSRGHRSGH